MVEVAPVRLPVRGPQRRLLDIRSSQAATASSSSCRKTPSPRSSVATVHSGLAACGSAAPAAAGTSVTRSRSSMRVNPMSALTLRSRSTASTRVIWAGSSARDGSRADSIRPLAGSPCRSCERVALQVAPFGDEQVDRVPVAVAAPRGPRRSRPARGASATSCGQVRVGQPGDVDPAVHLEQVAQHVGLTRHTGSASRPGRPGSGRRGRRCCSAASSRGMTMTDCVAGNHRLDAPTSISLVSASQPSTVEPVQVRQSAAARAAAWPVRPRPGPRSSPLLARHDSHAMTALAPLPAVRSSMVSTGTSAPAEHGSPRCTHSS